MLPEDLRFLARSPHAVHLKKLDLSGNDLSGSQLEPFQGLLQAAAATLLHLELAECQLADEQLLASLPVLTHCASLRYLGLYGNPLSMAGPRPSCAPWCIPSLWTATRVCPGHLLPLCCWRLPSTKRSLPTWRLSCTSYCWPLAAPRALDHRHRWAADCFSL